METKYLWDRVDALRDALKDIKEENDDSLTQEIEAMQDAMINEVTERFDSNYE